MDRQTGSDINVLAIHEKDHNVIVGDCKGVSWGFSGDWLLGAGNIVERNQGFFKAIFDQEWATGLANKVEEEFGTREFTYTIYCTYLDGGFEKLKNQKDVAGNHIEVVTLADIIRETVQRIKDKPDGSVEPTTLGRFVQLLRTDKIDLSLTGALN
jgi:hypothetical protein